MAFCIGVNVGTGSVRAGLFGDCGHLVSSSQREIRTWRPRPHFAQQSSTDIWDAVCMCVRSTVQKSGITNDQILGLGFDATCSLVAADNFGQPVSICPDGQPEQDIILRADHRAIGNADRINQTGHERQCSTSLPRSTHDRLS